MIPNPCIEVHTSPVDCPSVPAWFAEVVIIVQHLATNGQLDAFAHQIRLARGRFGSYEPLDFLALLIGYAISGERTLADFFERIEPFEAAFMALFGRKGLPHRATLSRFLAEVDRPCLEAFRTLFEHGAFADGWTMENIGGAFDRQSHRCIVFDVDATRQAARQRALSCDPALPTAQRRLDAVCALGYKGRKRGEVVRTRTVALQMHTRQWIGTYSGRGNGDYRDELALALQAITTYLRTFALTSEVALVRLDGQYGDASVIAQIILAGVHLVTRGRGYQILEHPHIQGILDHPPTAMVMSMNTGEAIELFDGGWLQLGENLPQIRVIVARHQAPAPEKAISVGKRINEWVYELFMTTIGAERFLVEDVFDLYHGRGAFEAVLADEDVETNPDRWCSYTECGQELWQITCQWMWNLRLTLGHTMQGQPMREIEWAPSKASPACIVASESFSEEYGPWQWAKGGGWARGGFGADAFTLQENGMLQCPAGKLLWLSEVRQEKAFSQRAVYAALQEDCLCCARRVSAVRYLLPAPSSVELTSGILAATRWVDVAGRMLRRIWMTHWRRHYVEIVPLPNLSICIAPPPRPPRAVRSHHRWSWHDRLVRNAWWGPPQLRIIVAGVPAFLASN